MRQPNTMAAQGASQTDLLGRPPDLVPGVPVTMAVGARQQAPLDAELEDLAVAESWRLGLDPALGEELRRGCRRQRLVADQARVAGQVERVLVVRARERVHRVPSVPVQV